jgi:hypothetical protein
MLKNFIQIALIVLLAAGGDACEKKKPSAPSPGELTEAQKAELRAKALANYKKLVEKYPDSENVDNAKERIKALAPPPGANK